MSFSGHAGLIHRSVIASEVKQSSRVMSILDCFVAEPVIGPAEGRTRWLLGMTVSSRQEDGMSALTGKNVVVIGGSRGVGRQIVEAALGNGARVLVWRGRKVRSG